MWLKVGQLNTIFGLEMGIYTTNILGLPGGKFKFRFDRYIALEKLVYWSYSHLWPIYPRRENGIT